MSSKNTYTEWVKKLTNAYGQAVIADLLEVTERAIGNWTADTPKVPRKETIRKIEELFKRHESGEDLSTVNRTRDYRDDTIRMLKDQIQDLKSHNQTLREQLNSVSGQLRHLLFLTLARVSTNQNSLADLLVKQKIEPAEKVEDRLSKENGENYLKAKLEAGIV